MSLCSKVRLSSRIRMRQWIKQEWKSARGVGSGEALSAVKSL
jgi:hypothetical protein